MRCDHCRGVGIINWWLGVSVGRSHTRRTISDGKRRRGGGGWIRGIRIVLMLTWCNSAYKCFSFSFEFWRLSWYVALRQWQWCMLLPPWLTRPLLYFDETDLQKLFNMFKLMLNSIKTKYVIFQMECLYWDVLVTLHGVHIEQVPPNT